MQLEATVFQQPGTGAKKLHIGFFSYNKRRYTVRLFCSVDWEIRAIPVRIAINQINEKRFCKRCLRKFYKLYGSCLKIHHSIEQE